MITRLLRAYAVALAVTVLMASGASLADTVTLSPLKDNTLFEDPNGELSNGAGYYLFAGVNDVDEIRRGLLMFDVASSIPSGATINSASLTLNMSRTKDTSKSYTVALHRVLAGWGAGTSDADGEEGKGAPAAPGDATWLHRSYNTSFWSNPGGDFDPAASASRTVTGTGFYTWASTAQTVADVQAWLNSPATNFGWMMIGDESQKTTAQRFDSQNMNDTSKRPKLVVNFTPGLQGDYNNNGVVDAADYVVWRNNNGTQAEYNTWRANFGTTSPGIGAANAVPAVPEPLTLVMLMVAASGWCLQRRRIA
jgi:hypothetical protein